MHVVSAAHHPTNLPQPPTSFVGRAVELAEIRRLLGTTRLVTLTGPGGSGKTRLALQTATQLLPMFADGVWWCDLVAVTDPAHVPQTVAAALGLSEPAERPALDAMADVLQARQTLIILDNCEQVLAACAALAHRLLGACPEVTLLATSLQPLGLVQERVWPTPPLALPAARTDPDSLDVMQQYDAVRLFVERARDALAEFTLDGSNAAIVATICRRLDGLPLALELAAARVRLLTVEQIAERLDDAFHLLTRGTPAHIPRHQALRAAMGWTYQFLTAPEQVLLRRLSVFAGSFTLEMVEAVCRELNIENEDLRNSTEHETACSILNPQSSILDLLSNLVDKSFVSPLPREGQSTACYRLLEPVRQYAREQLELSGEALAVRTRLLEWVVALAERAEPYLRGAVQAQWLQRIEAEHDNVRVALRWACTSQQVELGLRLANVIWHFWFARNYLTEGRAWLEELLRLEANVRETDH